MQHLGTNIIPSVFVRMQYAILLESHSVVICNITLIWLLYGGSAFSIILPRSNHVEIEILVRSSNLRKVETVFYLDGDRLGIPAEVSLDVRFMYG